MVQTLVNDYGINIKIANTEDSCTFITKHIKDNILVYFSPLFCVGFHIQEISDIKINSGFTIDIKMVSIICQQLYFSNIFIEKYMTVTNEYTAFWNESLHVFRW